jgi:glycosyltransferase involved in cell wall biosynthesis
MSNMAKPLITVVIPTRERCETLKFALETAINQATNNYEIVVSDNFSQDDTKKVVDSFNDPRVKYVNTGQRLSMCDNWDYALDYVNGNYVIFIGDDDGVMPGAIDKLQKLIREQPSSIYYWKTHVYTWPIDGKKPVIDYLAPSTQPFSVNLRKLVEFSIAWGTLRYNTLPCLYHSAVSKVILDSIKQRTGRVFHSTCPDVFMSFALPVFADKAINVGECLTVKGRSAKSNGGSCISKNGEAVLNEFIHEYHNYQLHRTLYPAVSFQVNTIADSALVAMDLFPDYYKNMKFNYNAMWVSIQRLTGPDSRLNIIKQRKQIKAYHQFNMMKFMFYSIVRSIVVVLRKIFRKKPQIKTGVVPSNIVDFVNLMGSKLQ